MNDKGEILVDWGLGGELEIVKPVEADEYGTREWGIINYKEVF
ncbi:hypothetical protein [Cellulophaga sp. Asnod2-G02]